MGTNMRDKIITIQVLRGIAALIVVYVHAIIIAEATSSSLSLFSNIYYFRDFGAFGVDIFFVLSGFIITYTSKDKYATINDKLLFLKKRLHRVYPVYWVVLFIFVFLILIKSTINHYIPGIIKDVESIQYYELISAIALLPYLTKDSFAVYLPSAWTLTYEIIFYVSAFISIVIFNRISLKGIIVVLCAFLIIFGFIFESKLLNLVFRNSLIIEFIYGVFIAKLFISKSLNRSSSFWLIVFFIGFFFYFLTLFFPLEHGSNINQFRFIYWGGPAFLIVLACVYLNDKYKYYMPSSLIFIGDASYSIYLTHVAITLPIANKIFDVLGISNHMNFDLYILTLVVLSVIFGSIFYIFIERFLIKKEFNIAIRGFRVNKYR
ncbi:acyltransferase family protein [Aliivibrio fischeri]|uniref:acyltransferase family protein n=1 Tax=Aliivibrio fischeri TaxID=668 RepID=UPI00084C2471|nr:acyltransferase [Aliivibrio fischeri]OED52092.1 hypothetical protein BEI47_09715 [Aliivibrio fischeri]